MTEAIKKLRDDLHIIEVMADGMAGYIRGTALFGHTGGRLPKLTLGGYLMRQHRLTALREALDTADQNRLQATMRLFNSSLEGMIVRTEERAHREFEARIRQWENNVRDLRREPKTAHHYYTTSVEPRAMLAALIDFLSASPFQLNGEYLERLGKLDQGLKGIWQMGEFVWQEEWEIAYPVKRYWWLYGGPRSATKR